MPRPIRHHLTAVAPVPRLELRADGALWARLDDRWLAVRPIRCFPWSRAARHISLRDADDRELALIDDPGALDPASRAALRAALAATGFVLQVTRVLSVDEDIEVRRWRVQVGEHTRSFQTPRDDWPRDLPGGGFLIKDVAGDLYRIPPADELDEPSRTAIWAFVG